MFVKTFIDFGHKVPFIFDYARALLRIANTLLTNIRARPIVVIPVVN